jgi:DNA polymerase I-like protein with 3'-5' exonuclease and polymerase domains
MCVNLDALEQVKKETTQKIEEIKEKINQEVGHEINPDSPKQVASHFYVDLGIPPYTTRNSKGETVWTTNDMALQRLARGTSTRKGRYEAKLIQEFRGLSKLSGTYLNMVFDKDNRFRCLYKPRGTRFSRISSGKTIFETGMNMQNIPDEFKVFLEADPGHILIELDKRQAEWVVVAYLADEANMIRVLQDGSDPHAHTASEVFRSMGGNISKETIYEEAKRLGHTTNPTEIEHIRRGISDLRDYSGWLPRNMSCRQMGKKSNHGLNYKEGYNTFSLINELLEKDAKKIIAAYHSAYPGIENWHDNVKSQLLENRTIHDLWNRKYKFLDRFNDQLWKAAISCSPQSTVGHLINKAIVDIYNDPSKELEQVDLLGQVHDSILFQFPITSPDLLPMASAIQACQKHMEPTFECHGNNFGIPTDAKIGFNWRDMVDVDLDSGSLEKNLEKGVASLGGS